MKSSTTLVRAAAVTAATALVAGSALLVGGTASAATILVPQGEISAPEVGGLPTDPGYNYNTWHQGYTDVAPAVAATVEADGLHIEGRSQILKGYDAARTATAFSAVVADASIDFTGDDAYLQLPIFANAGTRTGYTTLYPADPSNPAGEWITTGAIVAESGPNAVANESLTIAELDLALGGFDVLGAGVLTNPGTASVVSSFTLNGDTYQFALPVEPVDAAVTVVPNTISPADAANAEKGFTVTGVGFAPDSEITISFRAPDGTPFGFSTDEPIVTDDLGAFVVEHVYFTSSTGVLPAGIFVVVVTDDEGTSREANLSVVDPTVPAVVTPAAPAKALAATGLDDSPLFLTAGLGLLLAGLAAFGITVVARRRTA